MPIPATYSVYEAKARLSELLRAVRAGAEVVITDRGRRVARVVRFEERDEDLDGRVARLTAQGAISEAAMAPGAPWPSAKGSRGVLSRFLADRT